MFHLDEDQRLAVQAPEAPVLVLAGAGSGKTRVLTERVVHLIYERGYHPSEICALTFTNKAARQMHDRIVRALENRGTRIIPHELVISTFHSCALRLIKEYQAVLGYQSGLSIYDDRDQANLLKEICQEHKHQSWGELDFDAIASHFSLVKETAYDELTPERVRFYPLFELYQKKLKANNAVDFAQMLLDWHSLLSHSVVGPQLKTKWRAILVDEFQDTNRLQFEIIQRLGSAHRHVFVVGDEDQSIYRFRGATLQNILGFDSIFMDAQIIKLRYNYRSTQMILLGAREVVNRNQVRKSKKEMIAAGEKGDPISLLFFDSDVQEAADVIQRIGQWMAQDGNLREVAIFYRTHSMSRIFEDALRRFNIPYRVFGGLRFYDRAEVKDVLAYLRVIVNPSDEVALSRIINHPPRGLGKVSLGSVYDYASRQGMLRFEAVSKHLAHISIPAKAHKGLATFRDLILKYQKHSTTQTLSELVSSLIQESGLNDYLKQDPSIEGASRRDNVQEFLNAVREFEAAQPQARLNDFLDSLHLDEDVERLQREQGVYVSLMSCHAAKGLEFSEVFLVGCEEDSFPHGLRDLSNLEELEEERRIFYVAMTRAKTHLYISMSATRRVAGMYQFRQPSRFVSEIPQEYTVAVDSVIPGQARDDRRHKSDSSIAYEYESEPEEVGHWVRHSTFGQGQIVAVEGEGQGKKYRIRFPRYGEKRVLASFASLSRLD